ncbi:olfactory receptor 6C74-like [Echinops telfairi]|uniref:Olfactory receptor n=1 Tax=Echinops telfairi TaxID=9371 RepID=A0ABM1VLR2_ECHTE|nr:olfactory receptor 6C74-like [Echinops telfairi]
MRNHTAVTEFILLGLTDDPQWQVVLFTFLLITYMLSNSNFKSVTGNMTIILLTLLDSHLKAPKYFFLRMFSFLETSITSVCIPTYLFSIVTKDKTIFYDACVAQLFFTIFLGVSEFLLLAAMSYDRYVAICKPLHYVTIMNNSVCTQLVVTSCLAGLLTISPGLLMGLDLESCDANIIDHFACDYSPVLKLSCTDTQVIELGSFILASITLLITLALVVLSYAYIIRTILRIPSAQQQKKAFPSCASHMIVVSISYGSCICLYIKPSAEERVALNQGDSSLTTSVAPVLNPFVVTLRNKQVERVLKDVIFKNVFTTSR